jgi:Spy/CpxP family protein refolding chaperone
MIRVKLPGVPAMLLLSLSLGAGALDAQQPPPGSRRAQLEGRVLREFLDRTQAQMDMSAEQRTRIEQIMAASAQRHRELARAALQLRRELRVAVEDEGTSDAEFRRLLERMEQLRSREQEAWRSDQREIAGVLTPRQRAIFSIRWLEFQERVRAIIGQRRGTGPPLR